MFSVQQEAEERKSKSENMEKNNFDLINARVTFRNIPLYKIARFSFADVNAACEAFKKIPGISECVILQTGSRVEIYLVNNHEVADETQDARRTEGKGLTVNKIKETWLSLVQLDQYDIDHLDQILEVHVNSDIYPHVLKLASGLDSIIIGSESILDEIKTTIANAKTAKTSGKILNKLFDTVLRVATRIRETTAISKDIVSIGARAVKIAEDFAGLDAKKRVLLIGTGDTAYMVAKSLNKKSYGFDVTSMTIERATGFSKILGGKPVKFEDALTKFDTYDIIFVSTTADYFLITYNKIRIVMESKKTGTMILDISDPRAVEESVSTIQGTKLMFRDQIDEMEEINPKIREDKVIAAEKLISKEAPILEASMKLLDAEPAIKDVFVNVDSVRRKELEKALEMLGETNQEKIKIIDELTKTLIENIISIPAKAAKQTPEAKS